MNRKRQSQTERSRVPLRPEFARESRGGGHTHEPRSSTAANVSVRIAALEAELQELREQLAIERDDREVQERSWIESQRELELSRQRYADLYHHAPIGIVTFDRTGFVREANQTAATLLGVDRSRLLDRTLLRLVVPADRQKLLRHFVRCRRNRGQAPVVTELRVTGARRQVLNIALTSVPEAVMGKPHEPARLRTSLVDITAHKRIEEALRESEQRYRLAVDFTYDWESWLDPRGRYVYVSPSCERIAGRTPAEFLADAGLLRRLIHPADRSRYDKHVRLHKRRGGPGEEEWRVRHTDGSYRWIGHACQPVYDEHGEYLGIRVSNRDITAGKQAEAALRHLNATLEQRVAERTAALRESEERFRQMAESVGEVFWLADIHLRKIFYVSPAFAKIWGISCQQLYENPALWFQAVHPDDRAIVKAAFFQKRTGSAPLTAEYRIVRPDGSVRWIEDRGWLIRDQAGRPNRVVGVARDVTERRQMQSEIERISEMERQHLGRDLHDGLSQQLAGLAMSAQALRQALSRRDKRLGAKAGWLAKHAREAAETSRNLARSLYPASLQLSGLSVALKELALLVRQLFPVRCEYRGGFTRRLPDANVERQLFRIAQEAAFNAAKHSRGRQIWITLQPAGRGVVLTVADSGVGLNRRHLLATDLGLHIMHYRATLIRAVLTISRRPHGGTLITCRWQPSILTPKKVSRHEH